MTDQLTLLRNARRVGLVLGGGSMRCAFQVGVIELLDELEIRPSLVIAVSGGVWNGAAVAAGTSRRLRHYWRAFSRMPHIDVRNLARQRSPFIFPEMHRRTFSRYVGAARLRDEAALPMLVGLTRLRDRVPVLLDVKAVEDPFLLLLASNYLPPFYSSTPPITEERYGDGGLTDNCPYEKAFEAGCDAVILVALKGESEGGLYKSTRDTDHRIPPPWGERTVVIRPRHRIPVSFTERRWSVLRKTIDLGYLRSREVLLGERHPETDGRAVLPAPTLLLARAMTLMRRAAGVQARSFRLPIRSRSDAGDFSDNGRDGRGGGDEAPGSSSSAVDAPAGDARMGADADAGHTPHAGG
jgi:predicted acylesterase/phospholipase RssA